MRMRPRQQLCSARRRGDVRELILHPDGMAGGVVAQTIYAFLIRGSLQLGGFRVRRYVHFQRGYRDLLPGFDPIQTKWHAVSLPFTVAWAMFRPRFVAGARTVSEVADRGPIVRTIPPVIGMTASTVGSVCGRTPANRIGIRSMTAAARHVRTVSARETSRAMAVVECGPPYTGAVAGGALSGVVVAGPVAAVATLAVGLAGMVEGRRQPGGRAVTLAALAGIVVGRFDIGVARGAVGLVGMVEGRRQPHGRAVTLAALAAGVVGRFDIGVARGAVDRKSVV